MSSGSARNLELAQALLEWNQRHLHKDAELSEELIGECFARHFVIEPNGRRYEADRASYKAFLDEMKSTLLAIRYQVTQAVADEQSVVFSMRVEIDKVDGLVERFLAMLLVRFDADEKVSLWHEVYVPQG